MKTLKLVLSPILALGLSACQTTPAPAPTPEASTSDTPRLQGFHQVERWVQDGEDLTIEDAFRASLGEGQAQSIAFVRLSLDFDATSVSIGTDQVLTDANEATWCQAQGVAGLRYGGPRVVLPFIKAAAIVAAARQNPDSLDTAVSSCFAHVPAGTYAIEHTPDGLKLLSDPPGNARPLYLTAAAKSIDPLSDSLN